jgi:uncharacterized SAM-binding protein YcdF (DUF218 family)
VVDASLLPPAMYEFLEHLTRPFLLLSILTIVGLVNLWRGRREFRARLLLLTIPLVALFIISLPGVAHLALGSLEWQYPPRDGRPAEAQVIVVLSAGMRYDATSGLAELDEDGMLRCLHAAALYRQGPACPILVSGGKVDRESPGPASAEVMAQFLGQLGVASTDLIIEAQSRTTYENAVESAQLLDKHRLRKGLLVVDAVDMHRALSCFRKQGVEMIPAACHYRANPFAPSFFTFVPSPGAASNCQRVWHEWLGVVWYRLWGRI